jgi:hypothetical protein
MMLFVAPGLVISCKERDAKMIKLFVHLFLVVQAYLLIFILLNKLVDL